MPHKLHHVLPYLQLIKLHVCSFLIFIISRLEMCEGLFTSGADVLVLLHMSLGRFKIYFCRS